VQSPGSEELTRKVLKTMGFSAGTVSSFVLWLYIYFSELTEISCNDFCIGFVLWIERFVAISTGAEA
jgi:hypothetical protein